MVSVIIAVYEQSNVLKLVLESLLKQSDQDFEVVIADDGSSSSIIQVVEEYNSLFKVPINHVWHKDDGFRKTIIANKAVIAASQEYLIFIDGDCLLHPRFVEMHKKYSKRGRYLSGRRVMYGEKLTSQITPETIRSDDYYQISFWKSGSDKESHSRGTFSQFGYLIGNLRKKTYDILGCNYSIYRDDFINVNGYDESILGRGMEDNNLNWRLQLAGIKGYSVTKVALQYHLYHTFAPVPHGEEDAKTFLFPTEIRAVHGIDSHMEVIK